MSLVDDRESPFVEEHEAVDVFDPPPTSSVSGQDASPGALPARGFYTAEEMRELERRNLAAALEKAGGKIAGEGGAADLLGMKPSTLTYQLRTFNITRR